MPKTTDQALEVALSALRKIVDVGLNSDKPPDDRAEIAGCVAEKAIAEIGSVSDLVGVHHVVAPLKKKPPKK